MKTIVYQSYRTHQVHDWLASAMASAEAWSQASGYDYRFYGDEIFDRVPDWYRRKAGKYLQISTDLGRLYLARELLDAGYERVIWLDADMLVFDPERFFVHIKSGCAFGREIWVQKSADGKLKTYKNVHNAFACFCHDSSFLDFYIDSCLSILGRSSAGVPPQIVGTKLLTALHNIIGFQLLDGVGMASPLIIRELAEGGDDAIDLLGEMSSGPVQALNLCASLIGKPVDGVTIDAEMVKTASEVLLKTRGSRLNK